MHICKVYHPVRGGIQEVVRNIATNMQEFSHSIFTTAEDGAVFQENDEGVEIFRHRSYADVASMPISPDLVGGVMRNLKRHDLVALHYPFPLADLSLLLSIKAPPIIVHWHSAIVAQRRLKWLVLPISIFIFLRAKAIVVSSERMMLNSRILRRFRRKVKCIPYGISAVENFDAQRNHGERYFVMIARHVSYKGIEDAIRAVAINSCRLIIAGSGPLLERHRKFVRDQGLEAMVSFHPFLEDVELVDLVQQSIALVLPSITDNESFALVQLEAMRLGKPVINTRLSTSVPWVARHDMEGLTVEPGNVEELSQAMQKLAQDPVLEARLGQKARERFNNHFTLQHMTNGLRELYWQVMEKHPTPDPR